MLSEQRRAQIVEALERAGTLTTDELARRLKVSGETIRRDLLLLAQQQLLRRVHGGAMAASYPAPLEEPPYAARAEEAAEAKQRIGQLAVGLVSPGQTIVFDVGTTVLEAARALPASFRGTAVTCSLLVAAELATRPGVEVLVAPGRVRSGDLAVSNAQTVAFFTEIHADVALLGSGCVSADAGVTDFYVDEVASRRVMIANTATSYILADQTKFGRVAPHRVCALVDVAAIVTDRRLPQHLRGAFRATGGRIVAPSKPR
jgi:DeoR family transcriptional regulator, fructose operon transcriptional repressor